MMTTTSFPLCLVLMELSVQLCGMGAVLHLGWVPREQNVEADALTNEDFSAFDLAKRVHVVPEDLGFQVLPQLMSAAVELDAEIRQTKADKAGSLSEAGQGARRKKGELRWIEPW